MADRFIVNMRHKSKVLDWVLNRGGVAIWKSCDLSDPGASWTTPATNADGTPMKKPLWKACNEPDRIITKLEDLAFTDDVEVKRFHVGLHRAGLSLKCTDAASRRIHKEVDKAGEGAYYEFDYATQDAVIMLPGKPIPAEKVIKTDTVDG